MTGFIIYDRHQLWELDNNSTWVCRVPEATQPNVFSVDDTFSIVDRAQVEKWSIQPAYKRRASIDPSGKVAISGPFLKI